MPLSIRTKVLKEHCMPKLFKYHKVIVLCFPKQTKHYELNLCHTTQYLTYILCYSTMHFNSLMFLLIIKSFKMRNMSVIWPSKYFCLKGALKFMSVCRYVNNTTSTTHISIYIKIFYWYDVYRIKCASLNLVEANDDGEKQYIAIITLFLAGLCHRTLKLHVKFRIW